MTGGPLLFDEAIRETAVRVTVAVLADDQNAWYATGALSHESATGNRATQILQGASSLISAGASLSVLSSSNEADLDASEGGASQSVSQPYWAGGVLPRLSLQIIRHGEELQRFAAQYTAAPTIAGLKMEAYSGLTAVFSVAGESPFAVALYVIGNTYFGMAPNWRLDQDLPAAGSQAAFMISLYLQPQSIRAPSKPHGLKPGEAVEAVSRPFRLSARRRDS
jgi:hypothetical protein